MLKCKHRIRDTQVRGRWTYIQNYRCIMYNVYIRHQRKMERESERAKEDERERERDVEEEDEISVCINNAFSLWNGIGNQSKTDRQSWDSNFHRFFVQRVRVLHTTYSTLDSAQTQEAQGTRHKVQGKRKYTVLCIQRFRWSSLERVDKWVCLFPK